MVEDVKLNELRDLLESLEYPVEKTDAKNAVIDIRVQLADGSEMLPTVIDRTTAEAFESVDDLEAEIFANLPTEAVGEPGQSEGEG